MFWKRNHNRKSASEERLTIWGRADDTQLWRYPCLLQVLNQARGTQIRPTSLSASSDCQCRNCSVDDKLAEAARESRDTSYWAAGRGLPPTLIHGTWLQSQHHPKTIPHRCNSACYDEIRRLRTLLQNCEETPNMEQTMLISKSPDKTSRSPNQRSKRP